MAPLFWLGVRRGAAQLPVLSPFAKYEADVEMETGSFSVFLISLTSIEVPASISLKAATQALRYAHWCPAPTFWKKKKQARRKRRRTEEGSDEEVEDQDADASIAQQQNDTVLNRFEQDSDAPPAASRGNRMVDVLSKPYIDKHVRMELENIPDLMRQVREQIAARTGRDRGHAIQSADDCLLLTGHPTLGFKCRRLFNGLFTDTPACVLLMLKHPQIIQPHQLKKVVGAWNADPRPQAVMKYCGKHLETGKVFSQAGDDVFIAAQAVAALYEHRRTRDKQSFFSPHMHASLCNMDDLIQMESAQGLGVVIPHDGGSGVQELTELLQPPVESEVCAWWASDVAAWTQARQHSTILRAISMPHGSEDALAQSVPAQESGTTLFVCDGARQLRRLQDMQLLCCRGLCEPNAVDDIKATPAFHNVLQKITHVYILECDSLGVSRGLKVLQTLLQVCAAVQSVVLCYDPYLLRQQHKSIRLAHVVSGTDRVSTLELPVPDPVLDQPRAYELQEAVEAQVPDAPVIAFASVAQQLHHRLSRHCPSVLIVPRPAHLSFWNKAFRTLPLGLIAEGRLIWSVRRQCFGTIARLYNKFDLSAVSMDRWRIPGPLPLHVDISFQQNTSTHAPEDREVLQKAHVAVNELTHAWQSRSLACPCVMLLKGEGVQYPVSFLYRLYCNLKSGAISELVWVETPAGFDPTGSAPQGADP